jgi:hypothetical protein
LISMRMGNRRDRPEESAPSHRTGRNANATMSGRADHRKHRSGFGARVGLPQRIGVGSIVPGGAVAEMLVKRFEKCNRELVDDIRGITQRRVRGN